MKLPQDLVCVRVRVCASARVGVCERGRGVGMDSAYEVMHFSSTYTSQPRIVKSSYVCVSMYLFRASSIR